MITTGGPGEILRLDDPRARNTELTGGKATHLARAAAAGLRVLPGFVVLAPGAPGCAPSSPAVRSAWQELSADGTLPLVVRSSSAHEDTAESSMAGQFASVLDVRGWDAFLAALATVRASAGPDGAPMPVLVQPMLRSRVGGVLFSADPVTGRTDRILVSAVRGGPDSLVSGELPGTSLHLTRLGRLLRAEPSEPSVPLGRSELLRLAALARRAERVFGSPQDIEFGFDAWDGRLWLFQSRPITAMAPRPARRARLLGAGPIAETLPGVLQPLEEDLWVVPMAHGLATALHLGGTAARRTLRTVPAVTTVEGRAVADLGLLGVTGERRRFRSRLNPLPGFRKLAASWRVGRLRVTLPQLAAALLADVDRELTGTAPPPALTPDDLLGALRWSRAVLVALHAQEALAGGLLPAAEGTAAACALAALEDGRERGVSGTRLIADRPEVLTLVPPSLTEPPVLPVLPAPAGSPARPRRATGSGQAGRAPEVATLPVREGLRLRIRWVHEFQTRLVHEAAARLPEPVPCRGALLHWAELERAVLDGELPDGFRGRVPRTAAAPLPDRFRLADGGHVVPEHHRGQGEGAGQGVSGGRITGTAWDGTGPAPADAVLVVRTLDPALAPLLPRLAGLVAQTGSPLSHLAVLARELRLPAVTGVPDAVLRFPPGSPVLVDGVTGEVTGTEPVGTPVPAAYPAREETPRRAAPRTPAGAPGPAPGARVPAQAGKNDAVRRAGARP